MNDYKDEIVSIKFRATRLERERVVALVHIAANVRDKCVVPFCKRHNLDFDTGMGTWSFTSSSSGKQIDIESIKKFKPMVELLNTFITKGDCVGTFMVGYRNDPYLEMNINLNPQKEVKSE